MLEAANLGRSFTIICGADGTYSVELRLVNAVMPLLEPSEYKRVVEASPDFRLIVETGKLYFGAAENLKEGAGFLIENGSYWGSIVSLRGARGRLKHIATLVRSDKPIPLLDQTPEFREY